MGVRKLRSFEDIQQIHLGFAMEYLTNALGHARLADCPMLTKKIRSALKSAGGAERHMDRRREAAKALKA